MKAFFIGILITAIHSCCLLMLAVGQEKLCRFNNKIQDHEKLAESYKQFYQNQFQPSISSPSDSNVTVVGRWAWGSCEDVEIVGNYAYIGNGGTFQVLDISNAVNPIIIGEVVLQEGSVIELAVTGNYAYILNPFQIIDISNPTSPHIIFSQSFGWGLMELTICGNYLYIADFYNYIYIFDISIPTQPVQVGWARGSGDGITALVVSEPYLYLQSFDGLVIDIFDISDKTSPVLICQYGIVGVGGGLAIEDSLLYVGNSAFPRFRILDVSDPTNPQYVGGLDFMSIPTAITVLDSIAFITTQFGDFYIINISDKTNPWEINHLERSSINQQTINGTLYTNQIIDSGIAYIAAKTGLWSIDLQDFDSLKTVSFFHTGWNTFRAVFQDDYVYIASGYAGLKIIDVSNPCMPKLVGFLDSQSSISDIKVTQNFAYLVGHDEIDSLEQLIIADISDPENPSEVGRIQVKDPVINPVRPLWLVVSESISFFNQRGKQVKLVDITNPQLPQIINSIETSYYPWGMSLSDDYIFIAERDSGIIIYDVSQPFNTPLAVSRINAGLIVGINIENNLLFGSTSSGLIIFNIADIFNPLQLSQLNTPTGDFVDFAFSHDFLYMAFQNNLEVIDISDSQNPRVVGYRRDYPSTGPAAKDDLIYSCNGVIGLTILRNDLITSIKADKLRMTIRDSYLYQNFPNPFNEQTIISYEIPHTSNVQLKIYNILGEKVRTLVNGKQEEGFYDIVFNARELGTGVYFYTLQTDNIRVVRSAFLIK